MIALIISITLMYSAPLIFGALSGVISELSGVTNIGIEGMMTIGALVGATCGYYYNNPWIGFLMGMLAGSLLSLFHAIACVTLMADQTISGVSINLIGSGLSLFLCRTFFNGATITKTISNKLPIISISGVNIDITIVIALLITSIMWIVLYKTKWGLRVRAVGENPSAADTLGISVYRIRYTCIIISGALAGMGGAAVTLAIISQFNCTAISGQGFIALAAVIFGKWKPFGVFRACLLFGLLQAMVVILGGDKVLIPTPILSMMPYILTLLVLILFVGKSKCPKASGKPYEKGIRI